MHQPATPAAQQFSPKPGRKRPAFAVFSALALMACGSWASNALAVCTGSKPPSGQLNFTFPASVTLTNGNAKIGDVLGTHVIQGDSYGSWSCVARDKYGLTAMSTNLKPAAGFANVYESGVTGVGIRIRFDAYEGNWGGPKDTPYEVEFPWPAVAIPPYMVQLDFIRTGIAVGGGETTPMSFSTDFYIDTNPRGYKTLFGTLQKTTLINKYFYSSCYNPSSDPSIDMGRPAAVHVKRGEVKEHPLSLNIRCDGMNPTTKPPVKIYFEGSSPRDGLVNLTGQGQAGVAKGVGISVTDSKGVALPFAKTRALPLTWQNSVTNGEIYRFAGKAKYIATGGEITAGKANATLSYVLDYN